jgi:hypothetical protein
VAALRQIADLIAPFVQNVVTLHRERRRRERLQAIAALAPILGASLDVGELFERIANAVRPVLDFDAMGIRTARENGRDFQLVGLLAPDAATWPAEMAAEEFSFWPALARGDVVVLRHRDLDPSRPATGASATSGSNLGCSRLSSPVAGSTAISSSPSARPTGTTAPTPKSRERSPRK